MINCPNCQHENANDARFCNNCGAALELTCANCGRKNPPASNFCNECGHELAGEQHKSAVGEPAAPPADMQTLIPHDYAVKLKSAREGGAMVGERRVVTMLFCDIKGSTAAAEHLDPEEWAEVINQAFEYMIAPIYKYEGTVARLMGDGILAFFGAPVAHEDDPRRAVLAGLNIVANIGPFKEQVAREWGLQIDVRVGINTGLVMVGQVGSDMQMEYTALGDAINVAARMEQTAEPGTVQISAETYKMVVSHFEFENLGELRVKGKAAPVQTYRPLRRKSRITHLRRIADANMPMVGRKRELEHLVTAVDELKQGNGGVLCIVGEAGLGKSRLIQETALKVGINPLDLDREDEDLRWFESAALSFENTQAYALIQRLLRRLWGITTQDPPNMIREKIRIALTGAAADQEIFQLLLGVEIHEGVVRREGENFKRELYRAMTALWEREVESGAIVLILDDLQWSDPASVEMLIHLIGLTDRLPLLLVCSLRPDRDAPGWQIKQTAEVSFPHRYKLIALSALRDDETNLLVDNLLTISDLPPQLRKNILEKADGNPLFVEELVRSLVERGAVVEESSDEGVSRRLAENIDNTDIPNSLQSLLVARIDRLGESSRHTLQLASVIGRSFYLRVLEAIQQMSREAYTDLEGELRALQRREFIRQAARLPEPEYMFRHVLTQEAAYSTILLRERRLFHRSVGEAVESLFLDRLEEFYPVLAYHFGQANDRRALRYESLAGDTAYRLFAIPEALHHYSRAIALSQRVDWRHKPDGKGGAGNSKIEIGDELAAADLIHVYLRHGRCLELRSDYVAALQNYVELEGIARANGHSQMLLEALLAQAIVYAIPNPEQDASRGQELTDEAMKLAKELDDRRAEAKLLWILMLVKIYSGFMPDGVPIGRQAVQLARQLGMREQLAFSLQDLGLAYMSVGDLDKAVAVLQEAGSLWETLNNLPMLAENRANMAYVYVMKANLDEAKTTADESVVIAKSVENEWGQVNALAFVSLVYLARGEIDRALEVIQAFIPGAKKVGHPGHILGWFYLNWLYTELGARDEARQAAKQGLKASESFLPFRPVSLAVEAREHIGRGELVMAAELLAEAGQSGSRRTLQIIDLLVDLVSVELILARQDLARAEESMGNLLSKLYDSGNRYLLPSALHLQSRLRLEQGAIAQARESLEMACTTAEQAGSRLFAWQYMAELGEYEGAQQIVEFIAALI
ncbi:MAG: adenylate/guanylate cyclase domain-containing protein, partial [Candidatus Promineifilaceae bacterium]|nr:adenylate/guanylate cyclase domain-containing protein [Candidatus Promineifilaceae bacterium]